MVILVGGAGLTGDVVVAHGGCGDPRGLGLE